MSLCKRTRLDRCTRWLKPTLQASVACREREGEKEGRRGGEKEGQTETVVELNEDSWLKPTLQAGVACRQMDGRTQTERERLWQS